MQNNSFTLVKPSQSQLLVWIFRFFVSLIITTVATFPTLAQKKYTNEEKATIAKNVDSLVVVYMRNSSLTTGGESKFNDEVASDLMSLFTEDARIFDDVNPKYIDDGNGYPYKLETKSRSDFFRTAFKELSTGIRIRNKRIRVSYDDLENGSVQVHLNRVIEATTKTEGYSVSNNDTLRLLLKIQPDLSLRIAEVLAVGHTAFAVLNDADLDGLIDTRDNCKDKKGLRKLNGCPDSDNDGIHDEIDNCPEDSGLVQYKGCPDGWYSYPLVLSASVGYLMALNRIEAPEANSLASPFNEIDPDQSLNDAKITNPGFTGGIAFNAHVAYYFGKKKSNLKKGISLGLTLHSYEAEYSMNNAVLHYKDFDGVDFYRRIITIREAKEKVRFNTLNIPLMFRYRFKPSRKLGMEFSAGASFMMFFNRFSADKVTYDAEGAYAYNRLTSRFDYFRNFNTIEKDYLMLRAEDINPDDFGFNANATAAYNLLSGADRNYDFGLNRELSDKGDFTGIETRYGYALNGGLDVTYNIFYKVLFKAGASVIVGRNNTQVSDNEYTFITKSDDVADKKSSYNSLFDSNKASTYIAFGINVGIIVGLFNN